MERISMFRIVLLLSCILFSNTFAIVDITIKPDVSTNNLSPDQLVLDMIYITKDTKKAIINGKAYQEGEYIGPNKVHHIDINSVIISSSSKIFHLKISDDSEFMIHGVTKMDISTLHQLIKHRDIA